MHISGYTEDAIAAFSGKSSNVIIYVAGDDVMVQGRADIVTAMYNNIYLTHAQNTETGPHGLG